MRKPVLQSYRTVVSDQIRQRLCYAAFMSRCGGWLAWDERGHQMELSNEQYRQLVGWMERQQRRVADLERENRELRRQLDELRSGVGVSLVIQGRALPLTVLPAPEPTGPVAAAAHARTGEHPAYGLPNSLSSVPAARPSHSSHPAYSAPLAEQSLSPFFPITPAPPPTPTPVRPTPAPESTWLTGRMRAVRAPAQASRTGESERPRLATPSQEMTPAWLREYEDVRMPAPIIPPAPSWPSTPQPSAQRPRTLTAATGKQPAVRPPLRQSQSSAALPTPARPRRPTAPRLEPEHLPTLAEMTGRQPAVRLPGKPSAERSPFSDSFVLG